MKRSPFFLFTALLVILLGQSGPARSAGMAVDRGQFEQGVAMPPVVLIDFNCRLSGTVAEINWTADGEDDSTYYDLQRSPDGIQFTSLAIIKINGSPGNKKNYSHIDPSVDNQSTVYYRIGIKGLSSGITYSKTIKLVTNVIDFSTQFSADPLTNQLSLTITASKPSVVNVLLSDMNGRVLMRTSSSVNNGTSLISLGKIVSLPRGNYIVTIWNDRVRHTTTLIKK